MILRYPHWKKHGRRPWHSELSQICESQLFSSLWEVFSTTWDSISCPMVETCDQKCSKPNGPTFGKRNLRISQCLKPTRAEKNMKKATPQPNQQSLSSQTQMLPDVRRQTQNCLARWNPHVCWSRSDPSHPACFRVWGSWILAPRTFDQFNCTQIYHISSYLRICMCRNTYKYHRIT